MPDQKDIVSRISEVTYGTRGVILLASMSVHFLDTEIGVSKFAQQIPYIGSVLGMIFAYLRDSIHVVNMPALFMITGFSTGFYSKIDAVHLSWMDFYRQKLRYLLIPYLCYLPVYLVFSQKQKLANIDTLLFYIKNIYRPDKEVIHFFWFILMLFYVLIIHKFLYGFVYQYIEKVIEQRTKKQIKYLLYVSSIALYIPLFYRFTSTHNEMMIDGILSYMAFTAGFLLSKKREKVIFALQNLEKRQESSTYFLWPKLVLLLLIYAGLLAIHEYIRIWWVDCLIVSTATPILLMIYLLIWWQIKNLKIAQKIKKIGQNSIVFYIFHIYAAVLGWVTTRIVIYKTNYYVSAEIIHPIFALIIEVLVIGIMWLILFLWPYILLYWMEIYEKSFIGRAFWWSLGRKKSGQP